VSPVPKSYWEALRQLAEPFELMKFTLIYDGDLPSAGNSCKPIPASRIRNALHDQLADLWEGHIVLRQLARTARTQRQPGGFYGMSDYGPAQLPEYRGPIPPLLDGKTDLCAPIEVPKVGAFVPLVRHSLNLLCAIDVLFLRHEEPFSLMKHGGDLDGRIKTLFDALRMPDPKHEYVGDDPPDNPLYVVMEDDALISDFSVKSGRLLGGDTKKKHAVRLQIDVTIKVARVSSQNQILIGG
jgi:hypothetical protein